MDDLFENFYLVLTKNPYSKMFFDCFICKPIFKIFAAHFEENVMLNSDKKIQHLHLNSCKRSDKKHYQTLENLVQLKAGKGFKTMRLSIRGL